MSAGTSHQRLAYAMILAGFFLIGIAVIAIFALALVQGLKTSGGIVIFIGPIPIAVGWGEYGPLLIIVAVALLFLMVLEFFLLSWRSTPRVEYG